MRRGQEGKTIEIGKGSSVAGASGWEFGKAHIKLKRAPASALLFVACLSRTKRPFDTNRHAAQEIGAQALGGAGWWGVISVPAGDSGMSTQIKGHRAVYIKTPTAAWWLKDFRRLLFFPLHYTLHKKMSQFDYPAESSDYALDWQAANDCSST